VRATAWIEKAGIPAVGIICTGFVLSAKAIARMLGLLSVRIVEYPPPNIGTQTKEEIKGRAGIVLDHVIQALTQPAPKPKMVPIRELETRPRDIVFKGTLREVNDFFYDHQWTDGLPIIPPRVEAVEEMLKYTDRSADEVLAILQPARREATIWSVAVTGVMAGCCPAYMPVLIALIEAIAEPRFGLQHAGSTAGWTPLIVLNGPIIKELNFNSGQGVLRPQRKANITVSRFLRLAMMNLAGYQIGTTDLACFGTNYLPVLAEAEEESPYEPLSVERGFAKGSNVITVLSCLSMSYHFTSQETAEEHLQILANEVERELGGQYVQVMTIFGPDITPVLCLSPLVASVLANGGYSKKDIRKYIFEHARIPASEFDKELAGLWVGFTACKAVEQGKLPKLFCETEDPQRMLPLMHSPDELLIVVSGSATRNRNFVSKQTGDQGLAVSKEIRLPANWAYLPK
jgi:hypothetical protein